VRAANTEHQEELQEANRRFEEMQKMYKDEVRRNHEREQHLCFRLEKKDEEYFKNMGMNCVELDKKNNEMKQMDEMLGAVTKLKDFFGKIGYG
jgi:hypothetical protein